MEEFDANQPVRTVIALLTAGVKTEEGLDIFERIADELNRQELIELLIAFVAFTRELLTDEKLQQIGRHIA